MYAAHGRFSPLRRALFGALLTAAGRKIDRAAIPGVGTPARNATGEFLPSHRRQTAGFADELLPSGAIRGNHAPQSAHLAQMPDQRPRIDIQDDRHVESFEVLLDGFIRSPVRGQVRKFPHDQGFDIRARGLDVLRIRADIADVGIRQADDLPGITGIGENFLVAGKAGVENNFAAVAGAGARRAPAKDSPVLEREGRATCEPLAQLILLRASLGIVRRCRN